MNQHRSFEVCSLLFGLVTCAGLLVASAEADPLPFRDQLKFIQQPMHGTGLIGPNGNIVRFYGHDELSTAYSQFGATGQTPYRGTFMADDFADKFNSPVVHVKWWGSYIDNVINPNLPVNKFLISFESDQPVDPANPFSHPDTPLLTQVVTKGPLAPGSGTFTENLVPGAPIGSEQLYEYNAELHLGQEFFEKADTVYWLKIAALVDVPAGINIDPINPPAAVTRWGWHNRDYTVVDPLASTPPAVSPGEHLAGLIPPGGPNPVWHFQDDAVTGVMTYDPLAPTSQQLFQANYQPTFYRGGTDGPTIIANFSKDLAFALYTIRVPEPGTYLLMIVGLAGVLSARRRAISC